MMEANESVLRSLDALSFRYGSIGPGQMWQQPPGNDEEVMMKQGEFPLLRTVCAVSIVFLMWALT